MDAIERLFKVYEVYIAQCFSIPGIVLESVVG